ncbi:24913_t:CDS:2, partial [Dentiscutata erythropus]
QVQEWKQQKLELEAIKNNQNLNINQVQEEKIPVTTHMIEKKAKELKESLNIEAKCSRSWIKRFRKRHNLVEHARIQTAQKFPKDMPLVPKEKFPRNIVLVTAPCANMRANLMISTYIPKVIQARPEGFFKSKGIIFVDGHRSHVQDDVVKALNNEGLDVLEIPGSTTCILQPPDVLVNRPFKNGIRRRCDEWIDEGEREFTTKENPSGLVFNSDSSEDYKMLNRLQAIVNNRMDEANMDELCEDENELGVENLPDNENDEDDSNNEDDVSDNSNLTNSEDDESAMDIDEAI